MPWGRHVSLFYETREDLFEIVVPYLKAGLESNEFCMWVISEPITRKEALAALVQAVPSLPRYLADRRLELLSARKWHRTESRLDVQEGCDSLGCQACRRISARNEGVRVAASATRLKAKEWNEFLDYEDRLNGFVSGKALCVYPLPELRAADLVGVARTHRSVVVKRAGQWEAL